ncbi:hypothetical protein ACYOEI_01125 [Singulisphaera rosea]
MGKNDVEQFESTGESLSGLRRELEGKIKSLDDRLDPQISDKVPFKVLVLVMTVLIATAGWTFLSLGTQVSALSSKVNQLDKDIAVTNQKMDDFRKH